MTRFIAPVGYRTPSTAPFYQRDGPKCGYNTRTYQTLHCRSWNVVEVLTTIVTTGTIMIAILRITPASITMNQIGILPPCFALDLNIPRHLVVSRRKILLATGATATTVGGGCGLLTPPGYENELYYPKPSSSTIALAASVPLAGATTMTTTTTSTTTTTTTTPVTLLSDGKTSFPVCSFGLQIYNDDTAYQLTRMALDVGYRNFFASVLAGNQRGFARAVRDALISDPAKTPTGSVTSRAVTGDSMTPSMTSATISSRRLTRQDLFICGSVLSNRARGYEAAYQATVRGWKENIRTFREGSDDQITILDQIMLDYPGPDDDSIRGQWKGLEEMYHRGLVRTLSISNFSPRQLDIILDAGTIRPVVNQLPFSIAYHPARVVEENRQRGVLVQAWAPLGKSIGGDRRFSPSMKQRCAEIGMRYGKSFAQVALRWILQSGACFTTQSQIRSHFAEDLDLFDFELTTEEMVILNGLAEA